LADLEAQGLLVEDKPHRLTVPRGDRTGQVLEPYLTDQWFVKMDTLAARGLELVESGEVRFVPPNWINTYRHWMGNIQDWCISRQLWWGHRIPAWEGLTAAGRVKWFVARSEAEARHQAEAEGATLIKQSEDVLETWFSSALWSHSTLGWPDPADMEKYGFDRYLPTSVLVTGFDIIFFWVARMIMMTDHFTSKVPFHEVYITGLVRDKDGQKMSKSKGNILDPLDLIDGIALEALVDKRTRGLMQPQMAERIAKATEAEFPDGIPAFGADALRFTFASLASHGRDIKFDLARCEGYKNFCNKLWNAARYVLGVLPDTPSEEEARASGDLLEPTRLVEQPTRWPATETESWILARLERCLNHVEHFFDQYRFDLVSNELYEFVWDEYCDWFIELTKPFLKPGIAVDHAGEGETNADMEVIASVEYTLTFVLDAILRALHPMIPFVTEEIWQQVAPRLGKKGSIMLQPFPLSSDLAAFIPAAGDNPEENISWLKALISGVRAFRSQLGIAPSRRMDLAFVGSTGHQETLVSRFEDQIRFLVRADLLVLGPFGEGEVSLLATQIGSQKVFVRVDEDLVDLDAERARLDKEIGHVHGEIGKCEGKLGNARFVANAPAEVVGQERQRLADWNRQAEALRAQRERLG
ncbi:MAG TPA: class I tRNA ligase family protein, partial [Xanthomonadaceae bacterium]|nr:class I tRNA ligase family protein [Xanthomonadaceae bacterium]